MYKKGLWIPWGNFEAWFIAIYMCAYLVIVYIQDFFGSQGQITLVIIGVSFVLTALLLPVFLFYLRISKYHQDRANRQEMHMQAELAHFQQYKLSQEETARFRHDIKNNLLCVNDMLQQGKIPQATQYLQDLLKDAESLSAQYVTGDEILDSILAFKSQKFAASGIQFRLDGVIAGGFGWKPVDICNVFANALDNAIEACEKMPQEGRYITMEIRATSRFWFIRIENPVAEKVDTNRLFKKKDGYTSKADPSLHGLGTYTIKHTVESYGGMLQAQYEDQKFVLEIMVDKQ